MAMTACYSSYADLAPTHIQQHTQQQCYVGNAAGTTVLQQQQQQIQHQARLQPVSQQKDYSIPLHVDCSVEYELPNQAKPPAGARVEPLLMIHPCYFRKMESQRRSPFINNMPPVSNSSSSGNRTAASNSITAAAAMASSRRRAHQQQHQLAAQQQQQQQLSHQQQQLTQHHMYPVVAQQQQHQQQQWEQQQQQHVPTMPALVPIAAGAQAMSMYSKPVGKRDLMLSGGLSYTTDTSGTIPGVHWEAERSPLAAIPRDYQQSGPEHAATVHHQHQPHHHHNHTEKQQQHQQQQQQQQHQQHNHHNTILSGKYRQYLRAHRLHPYLERAAAFQPPPALQQVSCYNV